MNTILQAEIAHVHVANLANASAIGGNSRLDLKLFQSTIHVSGLYKHFPGNNT